MSLFTAINCSVSSSLSESLRYAIVLFDNEILSIVFLTSEHSTAVSTPEPDENGNLIEEVVDISKKINLEADSDDVQELLDFHNQGLVIHKFIEMHEQE
ncbi:hypothetical protein TNCV_3380321 [Trichonephila clavipes]|nr:hypothetical protein TNCV_3380321 [Trichonephila clavipes]